MIERHIDVIETCFCDLYGHELGDTGWAIVRRQDGREVAHFGQLSALGQRLYDIAWANAQRPDEEEEA